MGWDSNPRGACTPAGFQDRCLKPLGHPSMRGVIAERREEGAFAVLMGKTQLLARRGMRPILLWALGIPIPIIILLYVFHVI
jgi:hypothetical protein